jgi:hypothetical protein
MPYPNLGGIQTCQISCDFFSLKPLKANSTPFPEGPTVGQAYLAQEQIEILPQILIYFLLASSLC